MPDDAYWDELGIAWTAIDPKTMGPRLEEKLHWQSLFAQFVVFAGIPLCLAFGALGLWTVWRGATSGAVFFVTRGTAIMAMAAIAGLSATSFKAALREKAQSLHVMLELALRRTEKGIRLIRAGYWCCAIAAVFGQAGYFIRLHAGKPSAMSPFEALTFLAAIAFTLFLLQRRAEQDKAKYRYLKRILFEEARNEPR